MAGEVAREGARVVVGNQMHALISSDVARIVAMGCDCSPHLLLGIAVLGW